MHWRYCSFALRHRILCFMNMFCHIIDVAFVICYHSFLLDLFFSSRVWSIHLYYHICPVNSLRSSDAYIYVTSVIASDNGLSPGRRQAIIWTNSGILLIRPLGTKFSEILIKFHTLSFNKTHLKMSSVKQRPFCLGFNVLKVVEEPPWINEIFLLLSDAEVPS